MSDARARVQALVGAARRIAEPEGELGQRARRSLVASSGLSPENVEWALTQCLETEPSEAELEALCASVAPAQRAHVVLPANVFVAAHRAIALALAVSPVVTVRPSRREPHLASLLAEAAPGLFEIVSQVTAEPGDVVWAYGGNQSLEAVRAALPRGVTLHAQGPGFGVAVVDARHASREAALALAADVAPFDQRGCLSPRYVLVVGDGAAARAFAELIAEALGALSARIPLGRLDDAERADIALFRAAAIYAGTLLGAGPGSIFIADRGALSRLPPIGRHLQVTSVGSLDAAWAALNPMQITAVGVAGEPELHATVASALPGARVSPLGRMQRPLFDGPADRRRTPPPPKRS